MLQKAVLVVCLVVFVMILTAGTSQSGVPEIIFDVPDISAPEDTSGVLLPIYITNVFDTIVGFQFVLRFSRPDLITFDFSGEAFDTTGALVSGFEGVTAVDLEGNGSSLWFRCMANADPFDGYNTPGFAPQAGAVAVRLSYITAAVPDTIADPVSYIEVESPFDFSNPQGISIGVTTDTIIDTLYLLCLEWQGEECQEWVEVDPDTSDYDWMFVDTSLHGYIDTTKVITHEGSITVIPCELQCDTDGSGMVDIADLTMYIRCMFILPPGACDNIRPCDADGNVIFDISDLTCLIGYLFMGGLGFGCR